MKEETSITDIEKKAKMTKITGSEALMLSLLKESVEVIFGYPGGAIMPVYDALMNHEDKIRHS